MTDFYNPGFFYKRMHITQLPHSILLKIFQYLDHPNLCLGVRPTCKSWYHLSYDFSLWKILDLSEFCNRINDEVFLHILEPIQSNVEEINLSHCDWLTETGFVHNRMFCPALKCLFLQCTNITNDALEALVDKYPNLERLSVFMCPRLTNVYSQLCKLRNLIQYVEPYDEERPEDLNNGLIRISESCSLMRDMIIDFQETLIDKTLIQVVKNCRHIEKLQIPSCINITSYCFQQIGNFCKKLVNLNVSETKVGDLALKVISENCPFLEGLRVSACPLITDIGFCYISKHCRNLKCLVANETAVRKGNITDVGLKAISLGCSRLEGVMICYCPYITDAGIISIAKNCRNFQALHITGCTDLTDNAILALAEHCPRMTRLVASECEKLSSMSINQLVLNCPQLEILELETCQLLEGFQFDGIISKRNDDQFGLHTYFCNSLDGPQPQFAILNIPVFNSVPYVRLEILDLGLCSKIDDASVLQIAKYCQVLDYLSLYGCHLVTNIGIAAIAEHCCLLRHLNISAALVHLSKITNESLFAISEYCEQLQYLNLRSNFEITEEGVQAIIQKCPSLRKLCLTIGNETQLSEEKVTIIAKECRNSCQIQVYGMNHSYGSMCRTLRDLNFEFPPLRRLRAGRNNSNIIDLGF